MTQENKEEEALIMSKANEIILKYSLMEQIPFEYAAIGIALLFQSGAYLKSVPNRTIKVSNKEFTKKFLLTAAEAVYCKYTLRAIARTMKFAIAKIARKYNQPGHLYARFKLENATLIANNSVEKNRELAIYCADFQIENPDTPDEVREFLANREKGRTSKIKK